MSKIFLVEMSVLTWWIRPTDKHRCEHHK